MIYPFLLALLLYKEIQNTGKNTIYKSQKQVEKAMVLLEYRALIFVKNAQVGQDVKAKVTSVGERFATAEIVV